MSGPVYRVGDPAPAPLPRRSEAEVMSRWQGDKPVVSIRCATYQHVDFIEDALRGFLGQETDFPFEILVRDDASTDGTADIVRDYAERYPNIIRAVLETENRYPEVKAGQVLGPMVRGEFIAACEGDDYWIRPDILQICMSFMRIHSDVAAVLVDGIVVENQRIVHQSEHQRARVNRKLSKERLLQTHYLPIRGLVRRRDCVLPMLDLRLTGHYGDQKLPIQFALRDAKVENLRLKDSYVYRVASGPHSVTAKLRNAPVGLPEAEHAARQLDFARLLRHEGHSAAAGFRESDALLFLARAVVARSPRLLFYTAVARIAHKVSRQLRLLTVLLRRAARQG